MSGAGHVSSRGRPSLSDALASFDAKERFLLVRWIAGIGEHFPLDSRFREVLTGELHENIPEQVFVATDYHLNWLYAALCLTVGTWSSETIVPEGELTAAVLKNSSEDVDLLLSWSCVDGNRVILIEAKAFGFHSNERLAAKLGRLTAIFGSRGDKFIDVRPTFLLTGFSRPRRLKTASWPSWALAADGRPLFLEMPRPREMRYIVGRCDAEGRPTATGGHWRCRERR